MTATGPDISEKKMIRNINERQNLSDFEQRSKNDLTFSNVFFHLIINLTIYTKYYTYDFRTFLKKIYCLSVFLYRSMTNQIFFVINLVSVNL